jgi:hypothetical protein
MNKASILTANKSDTCPILLNDVDDDDDDADDDDDDNINNNNNHHHAYIKFNNCEMQRSGKFCPPTEDHSISSEYPADTKIVML